MGGAAEHAWQQAQSNDLGVGEGWRIIVGASPSGLRGMGFEIIIHEDINLGHLVGDSWSAIEGAILFMEAAFLWEKWCGNFILL